MEYVSTRGSAARVGFATALLAGTAPDGGLYMPATWPALDQAAFADAPFAEVTARILASFAAPWADEAALGAIAAQAYSRFDEPTVAPLRHLGGDDWLLELFHGPTLAFKDIAMQVLAPLVARALEENNARATILGATSGDTGAAAIEAFRGLERVDIFILHPAGRVSDVQRLMMTTVAEENVHNIAVDGSFDDCQRIVKALFADRSFAQRHALCGVNSINWARIAAQTAYYFTAVAALRRAGETRRPGFSVPTGNFGDAFAGYAAKAMGLECGLLCIAVNENDILHRAFTNGAYAPRTVVATQSPSMDIAVASNFERMLYEASGRDGAGVARAMSELEAQGSIDLPSAWRRAMSATFVSEKAGDSEGAQEIARRSREQGVVIDPHTAIALAVLRKARASGALSGPVITLATAHPAKFPRAVEAATGRRPALPERFADLYERRERAVAVPADVEIVRQTIMKRGRPAGQEGL